MTEIETLLERIAALEARVLYLETKTVATWVGPNPAPWPRQFAPLHLPPLPAENICSR